MRSINFIPFHYGQETSMQKKEVLYNIMAFVPLGVYIHMFRAKWKLAKKVLIVLLCSFLFEVVQFVFAIGASDITDLIGNTLGGFVGILFCVIMKKIAPKKFTSIFNISGLCVELAAIGFMLILLGANS